MKRDETARRAREIYDRLMELPRPVDMSNNVWAAKAGVNTSFFTNLRNGSEPSIGNLRKVLEAVGVSLPEFFAHEAEGKLVAVPSAQELEAAISSVLPSLPKRADRKAEFLAQAVLHALALPRHLRANLPRPEIAAPADLQADEQVHVATNAR